MTAKAKPKDVQKGKLDEELPSSNPEKDPKAETVDEELEEEPEMDNGEGDGAPVEIDGAKGDTLKYMKSTNRPYSFINIMDNRRGLHKKKQLEKILDG